MPQPVRPGGQTGSVLVGVLGLGLIMAMAAGSYVILSGAAATSRYGEMDEARLRFAAEAGIYLGLGWVRAHDSTYVKDRKWTGVVALTPPGFQLTQPAANGSATLPHEVTVLLLDPASNPHGKYQLSSRATRGPAHDTLIVTLLIDSLRGPAPSVAYTDSLAESYIPANP